MRAKPHVTVLVQSATIVDLGCQPSEIWRFVIPPAPRAARGHAHILRDAERQATYIIVPWNICQGSGSELATAPPAAMMREEGTMTKRIEVLFDERFLDKHAGAIISDTAIAIVELVANTWDAFASSVDIVWPSPASNTPFSITDNGKGLTAQMFEQRWRKIDYNRIADEGDEVAPPVELKSMSARKVFGRNGRGRHAAFRFSDPYRVRTWRDGVEVITLPCRPRLSGIPGRHARYVRRRTVNPAKGNQGSGPAVWHGRAHHPRYAQSGPHHAAARHRLACQEPAGGDAKLDRF